MDTTTTTTTTQQTESMFFVLAGVVLVTFILYAVFEPESEILDGYPRFFYPIAITRFICRSILRRKQGVLTLPKTLIYVAGGGTDSLSIQPKNHHLRISGIKIDSMNLKNYRTLCGYNRYDAGIPTCYPGILFIKGIILIITSTKFCLSPWGLIHIKQTIEQLHALEEYANSKFSLDLQVKEYRQVTRGIEVDIELLVLANSEHPVWKGVVTLFSRGEAARSKSLRSQSFSKHDDDDTTAEVSDLDVPGDTGLQYAKISGDWNPFHLYKWSAQLLGFRLPIAHGMWTLSKSLSVIQKKGYDLNNEKTYVTCSFKRPLFMPGRACIKIDNLVNLYDDDGTEIMVEERDTGVPHLKATVKVHKP